MKSKTREEELLQLASRFATNGKVLKIEPMGQGLINDTFVALCDNGSRYILQRVNSAVFRDIDVLQENLVAICSHIRKCLQNEGAQDIDRKVLTPVAAADGKLYVEDESGNYWRMTLFIEDSCTHEHVTPEMAAKTGEAFARFHSFFAEEDAPELRETIPDFHNVGFRIRQLREAMDADTAGRLAVCRKEADALLTRADEMLMAQRMEQDGELPKRTAHCDTKLNNILFDNEGNILCVIDLDTTMPGFVLSDFGDFIRTAANTGKEDDPEPENVSLNMDIFRAFAKGYVGTARFLTDQERKTLPFGARMLTYMQAVRFLTDYINGDTYYKIEYPEHNLVRTRAQMKLLNSIDEHFAEMENYINNL